MLPQVDEVTVLLKYFQHKRRKNVIPKPGMRLEVFDETDQVNTRDFIEKEVNPKLEE